MERIYRLSQVLKNSGIQILFFKKTRPRQGVMGVEQGAVMDKQREKLIELLHEAERWGNDDVNAQADILLANGVIVPPCKVGDKVYVLIQVVSDKRNERYFTILEAVAVGYEERCGDRKRWEFEVNLSYISDQLKEETIIKKLNLSESEFDNIVFLSRKDAKKALETTKEMKNY